MSKKRCALCLACAILLASMNSYSAAERGDHMIDFGGTCGACDWFVVLDGVMGGRSSGELMLTDDSIVLSGAISLENNGGFASVRNPFGRCNLSGHSKVEIRYRSTGQAFAMTLNNHRRFFRPRFKASLPRTNGEWRVLEIPLVEFERYRLSQPIGGGPPTEDELSSIIRMGLISNEKRASDYRIEVDYIRFK